MGGGPQSAGCHQVRPHRVCPGDSDLVPAGVPERRILGFRPLEFEMRRDTKTGQVASINFTRQELLEISAAPVLANQNVLRKGLEGTPRMKDYYLALEGSSSELEDILEVLRSAAR